MIERTLQPHCLGLAERYPVVTLMGPRQSGKTTLCRMAFPKKPYVSLEPPDEREFAATDPRGFLARFPDGVVIDEIQRVPELLSYLQAIVDEGAPPGFFVLTGSQNLGLLEAVTQTLAGRTALVELLPLGLDEIRRFSTPPQDLWTIIWKGGYPRIYDQGLHASEWLANYTATYVERDVRHVLNIGDLLTFQTFLRLCAGRTGQLLNLSGLGADAGVTHATSRSWISVFEAGYIVFRLRPFYRNIGKRLVKTPKVYFYDSGLLCYLLGIREPEQLETHPLRGPVLECWVISEIVKHHVHRGKKPDIFFYRDRKGSEIDLIADRGRDWIAVEIKSGRTLSSDYLSSLEKLTAQLRVADRMAPPIENVVVYAGESSQKRKAGQFLPWREVDSFPWA